jgi:hypothetical protein
MSDARSIFKVLPSPRHSHSIVSGAYTHMNLLVFFGTYNKLTVTSTAKTFRLERIDGDRYRKGRTATAAVRRVSAVANS